MKQISVDGVTYGVGDVRGLRERAEKAEALAEKRLADNADLIARYEAERAPMTTRIAELEAALRSVEWGGSTYGDESCCPGCSALGPQRGEEHVTNCPLALALRPGDSVSEGQSIGDPVRWENGVGLVRAPVSSNPEPELPGQATVDRLVAEHAPTRGAKRVLQRVHPRSNEARSSEAPSEEEADAEAEDFARVCDVLSKWDAAILDHAFTVGQLARAMATARASERRRASRVDKVQGTGTLLLASGICLTSGEVDEVLAARRTDYPPVGSKVRNKGDGQVAVVTAVEHRLSVELEDKERAAASAWYGRVWSARDVDVVTEACSAKASSDG